MPEPTLPPSSPDPLNRESAPSAAMFAEPTAATGRDFPTVAVALAAVSVLVLLLALVVLGRHKAAGRPDQGQVAAGYAANVRMGGLDMSESTNLAGGKETYVDGKITNTGPATVTAVTVEVAFTPDTGGAPQRETVPVDLIRMRQPELDTEPVSAEPIAPGATKEFRLIFDDIKPEWNQQPPEIRVTSVSTR